MDSGLDSDGLPMARASFQNVEDGEPLAWLVYAKAWKTLAVLASYCFDSANGSIPAEVEEVLSSIEPV